MLVSAVTLHGSKGYNMTSGMPAKSKDVISDTSFNSLSPYINRKTYSQEYMPVLLENINEWQMFCHKQILGGKLNIIA